MFLLGKARLVTTKITTRSDLTLRQVLTVSNNPVKLKYQIYLNNNITITLVIISVYNFQRHILIIRPIRLRKFLIDHY